MLKTVADLFSGSSVQMFPNPARDLLNFSLHGTNDQTTKVKIYDNKDVTVG